MKDPLVRATDARLLTALTVGVCLFFLFPLTINHYFYYNDDDQSYFAPMFAEIARLLKSGVFPLVTDRIWYGGSIIGEYQYGIFNPVSLALMVAISFLNDIANASAVFAIAHYLIYAIGALVLASALGLGARSSLVAAVLSVSSGWLLYFGAANWIPALVSMSWTPWCLWALLRTYRDPKYLPLGAVLTAMPLVSGWPFTNIGLAVFIGISLAVGLHARKSLAGLARVAAAAALGAALAMPAILPTAEYLSESGRAINSMNWYTNLEGLLSIGVPSYASFWTGWTSPQLVTAPVYYVSWFCLIVLVNNFRQLLRTPVARALLVSIIAFALLSKLPHFGNLRWAMRFLPFFHFSMALLVAWSLARPQGAQWRKWPTFFAIGGPFALALVTTPHLAAVHLLFAFWIVALTLMVFRLQESKKDYIPLLLIGHVTIFAAVIAWQPQNDAVVLWTPLTERPALVETRQLELVLSAADAGERSEWREKVHGNRGLLAGRRTVNGYSPVFIQGLHTAFCFDHLKTACKGAVDNLFERDAKTGMPLIDLVRIEVVSAEKGERAEAFRNAAHGLWTTKFVDEGSETFTRTTPLPPQPGSVTWMSRRLDLTSTSAGARREEYDVAGPVDEDVAIIFARPWYPGYRATLDGRALPVTAYRRFLPEVTIPKGASGRLVLEYRPAGLDTGLKIAAGAAGLLLLWLLAGLFMAKTRDQTASAAA